MPLHASDRDILDDGKYLTHHHLAQLTGSPELGQGVLDVGEQQPPSLLIRCDKGGGKTTYLEELVKANKKSRFVVVSCRRTLANALESRLKGFENYQNIKGRIDCRRAVVQAESLYRLDTKTYVDEGTILILDEVSSLLKQMCSHQTMGEAHDWNLRVFQRLIERATRVICLDADLCQEEIDIMKTLREDFVLINNTFQRQKGDKAVLFSDINKLVAEMLELLRAGKRLWISSTMSADNTEALKATFVKAGFENGVCVTKNAPESVKKDVGGNINDIMTGLQYFIHTPTVSVGVNYDDVDGVDHVIGLFRSQSEVDVETSIQMMGRARNVKDKTYLVYVDGATNNLPETAPEIKEWLCKQADMITGASDLRPTLKFEFDENTKSKLRDDLYHRIYCHVTALKHRSMNTFRERLIQHMTQAGCVVTTRDDKLDKDDPIAISQRESKAEITAAKNKQTASAAPISEATYKELVAGGIDLDVAQRASVHKFALMRTYGIQDHSFVTEDWVADYDKPDEKERFKNLQCLEVYPGQTLQDCLILPQKNEGLGFERSLEDDTTAEAHSRLERSRYAKLKPVVEILTACGFEDTFATNKVLAADLESRIDEIWPEIKKELEKEASQIHTTLKKRRPTHNDWTFKNKLSYVNTVLHAVLGVKISGVNKRSERYILKHFSKVGSSESSPLKAQT